MHIKKQDKDQEIFIKYSSWQSEEIICKAPTKSPIYLAWISITNSIILELWKLNSCLLKNQGKLKLILKSKKICENVYLKGNVASLFKNEIFSNLKPWWRMKSGKIRKYLKTRVGLKLFERKLQFWNLF